MKHTHEKKYGDIANKMRRSITDHTESSEISYAKTFKGINEILSWNHSDEELKYDINEMIKFSETIKEIPIPLLGSC